MRRGHTGAHGFHRGRNHVDTPIGAHQQKHLRGDSQQQFAGFAAGQLKPVNITEMDDHRNVGAGSGQQVSGRHRVHRYHEALGKTVVPDDFLSHGLPGGDDLPGHARIKIAGKQGGVQGRQCLSFLLQDSSTNGLCSLEISGGRGRATPLFIA